MIKPAFSTVACPDWTLDQVAENARRLGFEAVEIRTFGSNSSTSACDPALTSYEKVRSIFKSRGVEILSLATSVSFDEQIYPPLVGRIFGDTERSVKAAKRAIDLAIAIECPIVRVFGFEFQARERRVSAIERIVGRLAGALDHARNTGVKLVIENGGSFARAADLAELLDRVRHPLLGVCYSYATGAAAGDAPQTAVSVLGDRIWSARVKDYKNHMPCRIGEGDLQCREFVGSLVTAGFDGPVIFEWDRLWKPELPAAEMVLPQAATTLYGWASEFTPSRGSRTNAGVR